jgi:hypothetical protein
MAPPDTSNIKIKEAAARWGLNGMTVLWMAAPFASFARHIASSSVASAIIWTVVEFIVLTVVMLPLASKLSVKHDELEGKKQTLLPPHEFDEDIKYWERGDRIKYKEEGDGYYSSARFYGFTDDGTCVLRDGDDQLFELRIQDLSGYENKVYKDRVKESRQLELKAKADNSSYSRMLNRQRQMEQNTREALTSILDGDEDGLDALDAEYERMMREQSEDAKSSRNGRRQAA